MDVEMLAAVTQLLIAVATFCLVIVACWQLRESTKERRRSMRVRVLRFLRLYQTKIEGAIAKIPKNEFNSWNIKDDILNQYTEEFFSLAKDVRLELSRVSFKYQETRDEYLKTKDKRKSPETMKDSLENLKRMIEKEIDSLTSELDLDQV